MCIRDRAGTIFTYVSKSIEVDTSGIIRAALLNHKKVAVPRCVPGTREMEFYYIRSMDCLLYTSKGNFWEKSGMRKTVRFKRCALCTTGSFCILPILWE